MSKVDPVRLRNGAVAGGALFLCFVLGMIFVPGDETDQSEASTAPKAAAGWREDDGLHIQAPEETTGAGASTLGHPSMFGTSPMPAASGEAAAASEEDEAAKALRIEEARTWRERQRSDGMAKDYAELAGGGEGLSPSAGALAPRPDARMEELRRQMEMRRSDLEAKRDEMKDVRDHLQKVLAAAGAGGALGSAGLGQIPGLPAGTTSPFLPRSPAAAAAESPDSGEEETARNRAFPGALKVPAGTYIRATVIPEIVSDSNGAGVVAKVAEDVRVGERFDTVAIPAGSLLIGKVVGLGGEEPRAAIAWQTLRKPGGREVTLGSLESYGVDGSGGVEGEVDRHMGRVWRNALLFSAVGAVFDIGRASVTEGSDSSIVVDQSSVLEEVAAEIARDGIDTPPTVTIKAGAEILIFVPGDLYV